jgi:hypothetical protein
MPVRFEASRIFKQPSPPLWESMRILGKYKANKRLIERFVAYLHLGVHRLTEYSKDKKCFRYLILKGLRLYNWWGLPSDSINIALGLQRFSFLQIFLILHLFILKKNQFVLEIILPINENKIILRSKFKYVFLQIMGISWKGKSLREKEQINSQNWWKIE